MTTVEDIITEARSWVGTPFHHQGRAKGSGCDCAGLILEVARAFHLTEFQWTDYEHMPDGVMLKQTCDEHMDRITPAEAQPGDVVLFKFEEYPQHLGFLGDYVFGGLSLIHALATARKVVEHRFDDQWMGCVDQYYRLRGIA